MSLKHAAIKHLITMRQLLDSLLHLVEIDISHYCLLYF